MVRCALNSGQQPDASNEEEKLTRCDKCHNVLSPLVTQTRDYVAFFLRPPLNWIILCSRMNPKSPLRRKKIDSLTKTVEQFQQVSGRDHKFIRPKHTIVG